jgi:ribonuclease BN (tRNA processing enzyme)
MPSWRPVPAPQPELMRLIILGSGDAFGSGGRFNTCFFLETAKGKLVVDFGASSLVALKARNMDPNQIDGILLSHLHGDHFGGLPFLLLDAQFLTRRERPLVIAGPPGTGARLYQACEVFFPLSTLNKWRFSWSVLEFPVGASSDFLGHTVTTAEVSHFSGAPSTALRISDDEKVFAYSGDTEWAEALCEIAKGADLFVLECYAESGPAAGHMTWKTLQEQLGKLHAHKIMLTHMSPGMLARLDEVRARGLLVAADGAIVEF